MNYLKKEVKSRPGEKISNIIMNTKVSLIEDTSKKKNIVFEVDDFSKARLIIKDYCINENLEVYESDDIVSLINKELVLNDINVYRISEATNTLEKDFFRMIGKSNDKTN